MDTEYLSERCTRRRLERNHKKYNTDETHAQYVAQRDYCILLSNNKQKAFYSDLVNSTDNQGKLFKTVSKLWKTPGPKILPEHENATTLANEFNTFFANKIRRIREQIGTNESCKTDLPGLDQAQNTLNELKQACVIRTTSAYHQ